MSGKELLVSLASQITYQVENHKDSNTDDLAILATDFGRCFPFPSNKAIGEIAQVICSAPFQQPFCFSCS